MLVTGAAGALGTALVAGGAGPGRRRRRDRPRAVAERRGAAARAVRLAADLADADACRALPERAAAALGGLDVVINNAAVLIRRDFDELSLDDFEQAWQVNLRAPVLLMQAARPFLEQSPAPAIVNVISDGGAQRRRRPGRPLRDDQGRPPDSHEVRREGVRPARDPRPRRRSAGHRGKMRKQLAPELNESMRAGSSLLGRMADIREVALATLFAASPYASFMTGSDDRRDRARALIVRPRRPR